MSSAYSVNIFGYTVPMDYVLIITVTALFAFAIYKILADSAKRTNI